MADINLGLILVAAFIASASPGPATLALAGTSMASGRIHGLVLASGITCGSLIWSMSAAFGLGAVMFANAWLFEVIRYVGAAYLIFLALKSARSAWTGQEARAQAVTGSLRTVFLKGLVLHLTNPKAILFFGALYSMGVSPEASFAQLAIVVAAVGLQSFAIFHGYALLFSLPAVTARYMRFRRWFEGVFALGFGLAGLRILTARVQ